MFFSFFIWFAVHTQPFFFIKFSFLMWLQIRAFRNPKIVSISPFFHLINFVNIRTVIFWNKAGNLIMTDLMKSGYLFSVGHCQNLNFDMPEIIPVFTVYGRPLSLEVRFMRPGINSVIPWPCSESGPAHSPRALRDCIPPSRMAKQPPPLRSAADRTRWPISS